MSTLKPRTILLQVFAALIYLESIQCPTVMTREGLKKEDKPRNISRKPEKQSLEDLTKMPDIELGANEEYDPDDEASDVSLSTVIPVIMVSGTLLFFALVGVIVYRMLRRRATRRAAVTASGDQPEDGGAGAPPPVPPLGVVKALARAGVRPPPRAANPRGRPSRRDAQPAREGDQKPPEERPDARHKKRKTDCAGSEKPRDEESTRKKLKVERSRGRNSSDSKLVVGELARRDSRQGDEDWEDIEVGKNNMKYLSQIKEQLGFTRMELDDLKNKHESVQLQVSDLVTKIKNLQGLNRDDPFIVGSPANSNTSVLTEVELEMEKFLKEAREYRPSCSESTDENDLEESDRFAAITTVTWSPENVSNCNTSNWSAVTYNISDCCADEKRDDSTFFFSELEADNRKTKSLHVPYNPLDQANEENPFSNNGINCRGDFKEDITPVNCTEIEECSSAETAHAFENDFEDSRRTIEHITNKEDIYEAHTELFLSRIRNNIQLRKFESDSAPSGKEIITQALNKEFQNEEDEKMHVRERLCKKKEYLQDTLPTNKNSYLKKEEWVRARRSSAMATETTESTIEERPSVEERTENDISLEVSCGNLIGVSPKTKVRRCPALRELASAAAERNGVTRNLPTMGVGANVASLNAGFGPVDSGSQHDIPQRMEKCPSGNVDTSAVRNAENLVSTKLVSTCSSELNMLEDLKLLNEIELERCDLFNVGWYVFTLTINMLNKIFYFGATLEEINAYAKQLDVCKMIIRRAMESKDICMRNNNHTIIERNLTSEQIVYVIQIHWALIKRSKKHYEWLLGGLAAQVEYCFIARQQKRNLTERS